MVVRSRSAIAAFFFLAVGMATAAAQEARAPSDPIAALRQTSEQANAAWVTSAQAPEGKIARMLPCDPRVKNAIDGVSRASEARLAALSRYLRAAATQAAADAVEANRALAAQQAIARDLETDRAEAEQERIAVEAQVSILADSARRRPVLDDAKKKFDELVSLATQHAATAQQQETRLAALTTALREWAAAAQARQKAAEAELSALVAEMPRWSEYYSARLARAQTECSLTNNPPVRRQQ
ncbi:MAG: hypothetical protein ACRD30_01555 [Bryobacteraceae bacterium]